MGGGRRIQIPAAISTLYARLYIPLGPTPHFPDSHFPDTAPNSQATDPPDSAQGSLASLEVLGKRKAAPQKPPKKKPEKKPRRMYFMQISLYISTQILTLGGPRVEVEYEHEMETTPLTKETLANW